jgi:hypothetical protein
LDSLNAAALEAAFLDGVDRAKNLQTMLAGRLSAVAQPPRIESAVMIPPMSIRG